MGLGLGGFVDGVVLRARRPAWTRGTGRRRPDGGGWGPSWTPHAASTNAALRKDGRTSERTAMSGSDVRQRVVPGQPGPGAATSRGSSVAGGARVLPALHDADPLHAAGPAGEHLAGGGEAGRRAPGARRAASSRASRLRSMTVSGSAASALPGGRRATTGCGRVGAVRRTTSHATPRRRSRRASTRSCRRGNSSSSSSRTSSRSTSTRRWAARRRSPTAASGDSRTVQGSLTSWCSCSTWSVSACPSGRTRRSTGHSTDSSANPSGNTKRATRCSVSCSSSGAGDASSVRRSRSSSTW